MRRRALISQAGDTIVEVLVVLTILSLAFSIAYATANSGLTRSRAAEEHSEALGILEGQVELLRAGFANNESLDITTHSFCFAPSSPTPTVPVTISELVSQDSSSDSLTTPRPYPSACTIGNGYLYYLSITYRTSPSNAWQPYFDFIVRWDGPGDLGLQQEELTYKIANIISLLSPPILKTHSYPSSTVGFVSRDPSAQYLYNGTNIKVAG